MINSIKIVSILKGLSSEDMFRFLYIVEIQGENESVIEKFILCKKENVNDAKSKVNVKKMLCFPKYEWN